MRSELDAKALVEQINALLAMNKTGQVSHRVPNLAVSLLERAAGALAALPQAEPGWRSIESAPRCVPSSERDSGLRPVLVTRWPVHGHHKPVAVARLTTDGWIVGRGGPWRKPLWFEPTHWMSLDDLPPLPTAPTPAIEEGRSDV